jgi:hypothetical protein
VSAFFVLIHTLDLFWQDLTGDGVSPGSAPTEARP